MRQAGIMAFDGFVYNPATKTFITDIALRTGFLRANAARSGALIRGGITALGVAALVGSVGYGGYNAYIDFKNGDMNSGLREIDATLVGAAGAFLGAARGGVKGSITGGLLGYYGQKRFGTILQAHLCSRTSKCESK